MKTKRKTPVFSAVVLRVLEIRFKEIMKVATTSDTAFDLAVKGRVPLEKFIIDFDSYMVHLVSEFGDTDRVYQFNIYQAKILRAQLHYNDLNKVNDLVVNLQF